MKKKIAIAALVAVFLCAPPVLARDNGQWGHIDPEIRKWVESLKNKQGMGCCDTADGFDAEWDTQGNQYRVRIEGEWYTVPDYAVLDVPNRLGVAKVWYLIIEGKVVIRCFLPGSGT